MGLELKIYIFLSFLMILFYLIAFLKYKLSDTSLRFKYYMQDNIFYCISYIFRILLCILIIGRILILLITWWFDLPKFNPYE